MTQTSNKGPGKEGNNPPARQLTSCGDVSCELLVDPQAHTRSDKSQPQAPCGAGNVPGSPQAELQGHHEICAKHIARPGN